MNYKLLNTSIGVQYIAKIERDAITTFGPDPANTDYQAYLKWLEEGGQPLPADEVSGE
jgi:hypothetical protein